MLNLKRSDFTATNILIIITVLAYFLQINIRHGSIFFGLNIYFLLEGFYWQVLSTMFSHGGIFHLAMNMFVLWQFGNIIEQTRGKKRFIALYLISGILTSLLSFIYIFYIDISVNLVGASGAICAILGYIAYFDKSQRKGIITWILLISVAPLLIGLPIAWYSHFIGLFIGFIYAILEKKFFTKRVYL